MGTQSFIKNIPLFSTSSMFSPVASLVTYDPPEEKLTVCPDATSLLTDISGLLTSHTCAVSPLQLPSRVYPTKLF